MERYRITQLEIGYDTNFPAGVPFDFWYRADQTEYQAFSVTLIQGQGLNILFDCGFDPKSEYGSARIAMEGLKGCVSPTEALAAAGVSPKDLDAVILSHCHWDHMNGIGCFPDSKIYVQKKEIEKWKLAMADKDFPLTHKLVVDENAFGVLEELDRKGNIVWLDGDENDLFPWIDLKCVSGHSFAQNILLIDNGNEKNAVIGDVAMRKESFTGTEEFPCFLPNLKFAAGSIEQITRSYRLIMDWTGNNVDNILMSHDSSNMGTEKYRRSPLA